VTKFDDSALGPLSGRQSAESSDNSQGVSQPVGLTFILSYSLALFGVWMLVMTPATLGLAMRADQIAPERATDAYSVIAGVGALVALLANPMFGRLSDNTASNWGMRRPWMIFGTLGASLAAWLLATAETLATLFVGWLLMQLFVNAVIAALIAVIADQVPEYQRGRVSGIAGMTPTAGILAGTYFVQLVPDNNLLIFMLPALIALVAVTVFMSILRDRRLSPINNRPFGWREFFGSFYINPKSAPDFSYFLVSMFLIAGSLAVVQTYFFFFVKDYLGIERSMVPGVVFAAVLIMNAIALVVSPLAGMVSDFSGRRKPVFGTASLTLALGVSTMIVFPSLPGFYAGAGLVGVGYGIYSGLYIVVATETMVGSDNNARNLGLVNIAYTLPYSLIPMIAPVLLGVGSGSNYTALLVFSVVIALSGLPALAKVRVA